MKSMVGGYTIVETLIVLAVTGALFISAVMLFNGKQGRTQFTTGMQDTQSKIQDWANDVTTGYFPEATGGYTCSAPGASPPNIGAAGPDKQGSNEDCIFLGKALEFKANENEIVAFTILGRRVADPTLPDPFQQLRPTVAASSSADLTENFIIPGGAEVQPSPPGTITSPSNAGILLHSTNSYSADTTNSTSVDLYGLDSDTPNNYSVAAGFYSNLNKCIRLITSPTCLTKMTSDWVICFKSVSSDQFATITISPTGTNITSRLNFVDNC